MIGYSYVWYPVLELSPPQVMVSVAPRAPTCWAKKERIEVKTSVAEMIRDILKKGSRNRRERATIDCGEGVKE